jgi:hypothetical protein
MIRADAGKLPWKLRSAIGSDLGAEIGSKGRKRAICAEIRGWRLGASGLWKLQIGEGEGACGLWKLQIGEEEETSRGAMAEARSKEGKGGGGSAIARISAGIARV